MKLKLTTKLAHFHIGEKVSKELLLRQMTSPIYTSRFVKRKNKFNTIIKIITIFELFQMNFCKKRRNRMRNDGAAIIALSRSKSQNLASIPLEREGVIVYDERTEL